MILCNQGGQIRFFLILKFLLKSDINLERFLKKKRKKKIIPKNLSVALPTAGPARPFNFTRPSEEWAGVGLS